MRHFACIATSLFFAVTALSATFPGAALYIAAREAEETAKYADAIKAYEACAKVDRELAGFARARATACRAKGGDTAGAAKQWQALLASATNEAWAAMARAEYALVLQKQKLHAEAVQHLDLVFAEPVTPRSLDRYRRAYGDSLIALPDAQKRASGYALFASMLTEARTRTQRLEAARRLAASPDPRQQFDAAKTFVMAAEWGDAAGVLNHAETALGGNRPEYAPALAYMRGRINLAVDANKEAARKALLDAAKAHAQTEWGRLALSHAARSYHAAGEEPEVKPKREPASAAALRLSHRKMASDLFELLALQMPDTEETSDALWWLGARHAGHDEKPAEISAAITAFIRLAETCPSQKKAPEALFRAATLLMGRGENDVAGIHLRRVIEKYPDSAIAPAAAYECARIGLAKNDKKAAGILFKQAIDSGGIGNFYSHRAAQRLVDLGGVEKTIGRPVPTPGTGGFLRTLPISGKRVNAPNGEAWLARTRFFAGHGYEEAEWEVLAQSHLLMDTEKAGGYLSAIADTGLAATASYIINRTQWGLAGERPLPEALPALYPRAYWGDVQTIARETSSDPLLILAIARQESLFQAKIESHAGATGVMQLMPSTAAWIAKVDPAIGAAHALSLEKPASSLRLGGYYYRYIFNKNGGNAVFAIASYNAGPGNVSKWRDRYASKDLDSFIEAIPFDETRDFVKKVLGNYAAYHSIYSPGNRVAEVN
ncbi:MAG: transglycosylase SLT domain-containing protein [Candidatus Hydrogenedentes bacterium]|nr:transglycosylase SLT domain-containing protein [Candidatus Hydrogenedentota bacterium]